MTPDLARRRSLLTAALGFLQIDRTKLSHTGLTALHTWLDNWQGLGAATEGMLRQGFEIDLTAGPDGSSATFLKTRPIWRCRGSRFRARHEAVASGAACGRGRRRGRRRPTPHLTLSTNRGALLLREHSFKHLVCSSNIRASSAVENQSDDLLSIWDGDGSLRSSDISQRRQRHGERYGDPIETVYRDGLLSALHLADKLAAETGTFAESGLAVVSALSKFSETLTEKLPNVGNRALGHGVVISRLNNQREVGRRAS